MLDCLQYAVTSHDSEEARMALTILTVLVKAGESKRLAENDGLLKAMMKLFNRTAEELQDSAEA